MVQQPHRKHRIGTAELTNSSCNGGIVVVRLDQLHMLVPTACKSAPGGLEPLFGTVDRYDMVEERRQQLDQRAITGAEVDSEATTRQERANRGEVGRPCRRGELRRVVRGPLEEDTRLIVTRPDHLGHSPEAAILDAELTARLNRVGEHRITIQIGRQAGEGAGSLTANGDQAGLPKLLEVFGHVGLRFPGELCELSDRQLVLGGQAEQAEPSRLSKEAIELPTRGS